MARLASRVSARLKALLADTLFKRLFALMWLALVISHAVAFLVVTRNGLGAGGRWPTFPSLPPFSFTQRAAPAAHTGASAPRAPASGARMPFGQPGNGGPPDRRGGPGGPNGPGGPGDAGGMDGPRGPGGPPPFSNQAGMGAPPNMPADGPTDPGAPRSGAQGVGLPASAALLDRKSVV